MSGIMPHLAYCRIQNMHTDTFTYTRTHEDTQFPLLNNVFVVLASFVFALCQLYLT